jgi:protein SCO1/2
MKTKTVSKIIFTMIISNFLGAGVALACDDHNMAAAETKVLPGNSVYQLQSTWVDQKNSKIKFSELAGKPRIIAMVYTKCKSACPLLVHDIKGTIAKLPKNISDQIQIDLFSFDSEEENSNSLSEFKSKYELSDNWSIFYGNKGSVAELAAVLGVQYKKLDGGEYVHSNVVFYLNEYGEIKGKQEGLGRDSSDFIQSIEKNSSKKGN